jgi:shikimate dehydrogenase
MKLYGIIGDPVEHSVSPPMHATAYEATGIDATYSRYRVGEDDVRAAVRGADALSIDGLNVTVPHKETVSALDGVALDETAERIGAVNTVDFGDEVRGYNTDASGALRAIERETDVAGKDVVVVGAGGAGRAVSFALAEEGATVRIANRTFGRAETVADELCGFGEATPHSLDELGDVVPDADIVVNATTVGMEEDVSPVPADALRSHHVVFDVVYTPLETRLLHDADDAGATTVDGAWMLVYQGAEAFEIWTGRDAPVEDMNDALREEI